MSEELGRQTSNDAFLARAFNNTEFLKDIVINELNTIFNSRKSVSPEVNFQMQVIGTASLSQKSEERELAANHNKKNPNDIIAFFNPKSNHFKNEPFFINRLEEELKMEKVSFGFSQYNASIMKFSISSKVNIKDSILVL